LVLALDGLNAKLGGSPPLSEKAQCHQFGTAVLNTAEKEVMLPLGEAATTYGFVLQADHKSAAAREVPFRGQ